MTQVPSPSTAHSRRLRLLVFIVAYDAERTIADVLTRIPHDLADDYEVEVLVIDDESHDATFERGEALGRANVLPFPVRVLFNPVNQGYGGNQKIGFHFAIDQGFDFVALLHGDGQYAPECLPDLVRPLVEGEASAVMGSRMMEPGAARRGGMPIYKYTGNKILTWWENWMLRTHLSEFHSGYRAYSTAALRTIPFGLNTDEFHFDTEIIIQLVRAGERIVEVPIPTYYGDEICHVNGVTYGWAVVKAAAKSRVQEMSLLYDRKFDVAPASRDGNARYLSKLEFESPQSLAYDLIAPGSKVLDLGCAGGALGGELRERKGCYVVGVDICSLAPGVELDEFLVHDLNQRPLPVDVNRFDVVVMLDVVEHLADPEAFIEDLRAAAALSPDLRLVISTGNVAFLVTRMLLMAGQFNYGRRGILDLTHTRLFTFASFRRLLEGAGFEIILQRGVPPPVQLAVGSGRLGRGLFATSRAMTRVRSQIFAYQSFVVARPRPSLAYLLTRAQEASAARSTASSERRPPA